MIKTWQERCEEHPDHQTGMVSNTMIQARMQEEIDALRAALAKPEPTVKKSLPVARREETYDMNDQEIQAKELTAPRITPQDIEANIVSEHYFTAREGRAGAIESGTYVGRENPAADNSDLRPLELLTFCVLVLKNGFTVTGESACVSPKNFDAKIGRKIAWQNAVAKVWPLMGYELRSNLARNNND